MSLGKSLVAIIGLFAMSATHADWIGPYPVRYVEIYNGALFLQLDGIQEYAHGGFSLCANKTSIMFLTNPSNPKDLDRILASALSARASDMKVKIYINDCQGGMLTGNAIASDPAW